MTKREQAELMVEEAVFIDGFDDAIVGVNTDGRIVYNYDQMIDCLSEMSAEDADEYIQYNTVRSLSYIDNPPIIFYPLWEE